MCYITPDIIEVKALRDYYIYLRFKTGEEKVYDMAECIEKIEYYKNSTINFNENETYDLIMTEEELNIYVLTINLNSSLEIPLT